MLAPALHGGKEQLLEDFGDVPVVTQAALLRRVQRRLGEAGAGEACVPVLSADVLCTVLSADTAFRGANKPNF